MPTCTASSRSPSTTDGAENLNSATMHWQSKKVSSVPKLSVMNRIAGLAISIQDFCERVQTGLANADFAQKRHLIELLVDRVTVKDTEVEIRYVISTTPGSEHVRFCHLRTDYLNHPAVTPEPFAAVNAASCDSGLYSSLAQCLAAFVVVIALVGMDLVRALSRSALQACHRINNGPKAVCQHRGRAAQARGS